MSDFRTSLMREKFVIRPSDEDGEDIIALSNRISIHLISEDKIDDEIFIIRTQNMHSCTRLAASITKEFFERGTIAGRMVPVDWEIIWGDVIKGYEKDWNPDIWCVIYHKGRVMYSDGEHHPFLDIIEQCDAANKGEYVQSVAFAESAFSKAGKEVTIEHDSNAALVASIGDESAKCGIIVRGATGTTTFNYTSSPSPRTKRPVQAHTTLTVAAAFLEAIQLAFQVGLLNRKQELNLIERYSEEYRRHDRSQRRLTNLNTAISNYENSFKVTYRPDRPAFQEMVDKAQKFADKILEPQMGEEIEDAKQIKKEEEEKKWLQ